MGKRDTMNRRRLLQASAGAAAIAAVAPRIGLAQESTPAASLAASGMATPVGTVDENGFYPSGTPGVPDAWTKMPERFKSTDGVPGSGGKVTASSA